MLLSYLYFRLQFYYTLTKLLKRREIFVLFINFVCFFYSCLFERTHLKLAFLMYVSLCQNTELHVMNEEKIPQWLYYLLEDAYRTFYHTVFLEVTKSYGIISNGLKVKKDACIGNVSKNFFASCDLQLFKAEIQLMEVLILEHVRKLFAIEENFNSLFKHHTVQEDWLFRTRNHLEKLEKAER